MRNSPAAAARGATRLGKPPCPAGPVQRLGSACYLLVLGGCDHRDSGQVDPRCLRRVPLANLHLHPVACRLFEDLALQIAALLLAEAEAESLTDFQGGPPRTRTPIGFLDPGQLGHENSEIRPLPRRALFDL